MVEQAVHVWDVLHWIAGESPVRASGWGRRGLFAATDPLRDVTDHYAVELEWADGFRASFVQSWVAPADDGFTGSTLRVMGEQGGFDFGAARSPSATVLASPPGPTRATARHPDGARGVPGRGPLRVADPAPITLADARAATEIGLLVRKAVDERRVVTIDEVTALECPSRA